MRDYKGFWCEHNRMSWLNNKACPKCKKSEAYKSFTMQNITPTFKKDKKDELIKTQGEYITFFTKHEAKHIGYLHIHGIVTSEKDVEKGKKFREKIAKLKKEIYGGYSLAVKPRSVKLVMRDHPPIVTLIKRK